jgi:glycosyltransferase involved in cell wall biosynthesis
VHSFYSGRQPSGENAVVVNELAALRRAGHDVALFASHTDDHEGERFYKLRSGLRVATGRGRNPLDEIARFSPDVVHVHNLFPNYGRQWVNDYDGALVHTLHNYRPLCANGLFFRNGQVCTACIDVSRWEGLRYACYRDSRLATLPLSISGAGGPEGNALLRRADRLIVLSALQRQLYHQAGVPAERLSLSPNFLPDDLDPGPQYKGGASFVGVGRLTPEKGFADLVRAWPDDESLLILGDGPERSEIEGLGKPGVRLLGTVDRPTVLRHLGRARGLVFPSRWFEASPLVHLEALATATPIAAAAGNSVAASIAEYGGGVVVEGTDWGTALARISGREAERREARAIFESTYTEAAYATGMIDTYAECVAGRSSS